MFVCMRISQLYKRPLFCHYDFVFKARAADRLMFNQYLISTSRKQVRVTNTPYTSLLYSKTGVYRGIHFFLFLLQKVIEKQ